MRKLEPKWLRMHDDDDNGDGDDGDDDGDGDDDYDDHDACAFILDGPPRN